MGTVTLRIAGGTKRYPGDGQELTVFHSLDLDVREGEVVALLGPSGCGKSTLLRALGGLEPLSAGRVDRGGCGTADADGRDLPLPLGVVFQEPLLFPWLTVAENVALGLRYRANRARCATDSVGQILHELGLSSIANAYPNELSGGQAQRANLARTIVTRPAILLLDEPFSALDPRTRATLQDWLLEIVRRRGLTVVLVTHDVDEALHVGDRVALMSSRPGTIVKIWDVRRHLAASDRNGGAPRSADPRTHGIRQEILAFYQADAPAPPSPTDWII